MVKLTSVRRRFEHLDVIIATDKNIIAALNVSWKDIARWHIYDAEITDQDVNGASTALRFFVPKRRTYDFDQVPAELSRFLTSDRHARKRFPVNKRYRIDGVSSERARQDVAL